MSLNKEIGKRLLEVRVKWGLTQDQMANKIGISRPLYVGYENVSGKGNVSKKSVEKVIKNLNINEDWLLKGEGVTFSTNKYKENEAISHIIEEPLSDFNINAMNPEIERLQKQVDRLMSTVEDQAASIRDYAAAEKENARSRANLSETVIIQAHAIANLTGKVSKKASGGD